MMSFSKSVLFSLTLLSAANAFAEMVAPARSIQEVSDHSETQETLRVTTARIVLVDYALIRHDFANLQNASDAAIDSWILSQTAFITREQADQTFANTPITTAEASTAFRPPDYNRALVLKVEGGLIDGKGYGTLHPRPGDHSDGCATLGEVIREYLYQKLVQKVFDDSRSGIRTVGSYAVLDWGFSVKHADGSTSPAGAILRQAHHRHSGWFSLFGAEQTKQIELILRKYGLTSAGAYRNVPVEKLNLQGTTSFDVIDFGGFLSVDHFSKPATEFFQNKVLLQQGDVDFIQPNADLRVPFQLWGTTVSGIEDPKKDNVWIWSHQLASAFAEGRANRDDVWKHYTNMIRPVEERFQHFHSMRRQCAAYFSH